MPFYMAFPRNPLRLWEADEMDPSLRALLGLDEEESPTRFLNALDSLRVVTRKGKVMFKTKPTAYSKLKPDKKAEALDLLHSVAKNGYGEQFLELAYDHGVPLAEKGKGGHSAVHLIAEHGHVQLMKDLLTKEFPEIAEVLRDELRFREQLERAKTHQNMVTLMLGKYVKNKSKHGWRPLHFAVKACAPQQVGEGGKKMVALLLLAQGDSSMLTTQKRTRAKKSGEEPKRNKAGGESPVHIAAKYGTVPALELIWEWCDVFGTEGENGGKFEPFKEPDKKGWTPLHHAVATNRSIVVEWLLEKRPLTRLSVDTPSEKGYTALMTAAEYKCNEMCELLLRKGAKVDCAAADGLTALHLAAMHDNKELVELLLEKGASCKDQDKDGNTPLHIARKKYCLEAAAVLESHDKTVLEVENKDGYTPETIPPEDKEVIPQEIRKRGKEAIRVYEEALKDGKTKIPHVKFVLLGETRHGKTSLLRLLEGEEFEPDSSSTDGIDCDLVSSKTLVGDSWKKHDRLNSTDALAGILMKSLPEATAASTGKHNKPWESLSVAGAEHQIAKLFRPAPSVVPRGGHRPQPLPAQAPPRGVPAFEAASTHGQHEFQPPHSLQHSTRFYPMAQASQPQSGVGRDRTRHPQQQHERSVREWRASLPRRPEEPRQDNIAEQPEDTPDPPRPTRILPDPSTSRALDRKLKSGGSDIENPKLTFTTYDFAGQDLYRPMHHCFITQRSVFVIVYNSQEYNRLRKEGDQSRYKYISYWFNTVSAYTEVMGDLRFGMKPPVFIVGTHRGHYDDGKGKKFSKLTSGDEKGICEDLEECYKEGDTHDRYLGHLKSDRGHFYFVESSQEDEENGAPGLRFCLRKEADSLPFMKQEYPVRWLQLEEKLKDRGLVLLADVKDEAKAVGFPFPPTGGECKEFHLAMQFLHDIGVITYPCELPRVFLSDDEMKTLKKVVLCGPQFLPNMMKEIVLFEKHLKDLPHADHKVLTQRHMATENALRVVFKEFLDPNSKDESLRYLSLLLRAYGLIVKAEEGSSDHTPPPPAESPQYLVPCRLKHQEIIPKPERESFSFVADFYGYLPQEVFTRFVCCAALKAKESVLKPRPKSKTKCHLMQNFCSVKHFMINGDAWSITYDEANSRMVFDVSVPHKYEEELVQFVYFASKQLHQLCQDLKLSGLVYQVGKEFTCKNCSEEGFFEVASQEQDRNPQMELEGECDSCSCAVTIRELLSQDLEQMNDKLKATPTEEQLLKYICKEVGEKWEEVCTFLSIPYKKITEIKQNNPLKMNKAFFQCLMHWAGGNTEKEPTWLVLLGALEDAELKGVATPLKKRILNDRL